MHDQKPDTVEATEDLDATNMLPREEATRMIQPTAAPPPRTRRLQPMETRPRWPRFLPRRSPPRASAPA